MASTEALLEQIQFLTQRIQALETQNAKYKAFLRELLADAEQIEVKEPKVLNDAND